MSQGKLPEELVELLQQTDSDCSFLFEQLVGKMQGKLANAATYVSSLLLARVITGLQAVDLLLRNDYVIEAGVVTLSVFETKLDMLYVGTDAKRGDYWLRHEDPIRQPWSVAHKINSIYEGDLRQREQTTFQFLSAIKHGNPTAGPAGYPERRNPELWEIKTGGFDDSINLSISLIIGRIAREQLLDCALAFCRVHEWLGVLNAAAEQEFLRRRNELIGGQQRD